MSLLLLLALPVFAETRTFGGADAGMECEIDAHNVEALLDISVTPVKTTQDDKIRSVGPVEVSYNFLQMQLDRVEMRAFTFEKRLQEGQVKPTAIFGQARWDREDAFVEVAPIGGGVNVRIVPGVRVQFGGDVHYRFLADTEDVTGDFWSWSHQLFIGLPMGVTWASRPSNPLFAENTLQIRPSLRILGDLPFAFDMSERLTGGYALVQSEELTLRTAASYELRLDTGVWDSPALTHRFWLGIATTF